MTDTYGFPPNDPNTDLAALFTAGLALALILYGAVLVTIGGFH